VVVAGGGPAGFMAAITAAEAGVPDVHILEATSEPLHKVLISGGGRCNVTHACWDPRALTGHYPRGGRALRGPFSRFAAADAVAWFKARGLELVEEPDGRMFPRANRSSAVIAVLRRAAARAGVTLHTGVTVRDALARSAGGFSLGLRTAGTAVGAATAERISCQRLVLATGSHPSGRRLAGQLGHGQVPPLPSLFSLALVDRSLAPLAGLVVDPVELQLQLPSTAGMGAGERFREVGPVLITHRGLSGPATLRLTAFAARALHAAGYRAELQVRWSGGRDRGQLEELLVAARRQQARRQLGNGRPWPELPRRLWLHLLDRSGVDAELRWADLSKAAGRLLVEQLVASRYGVSGRGPFGEEFVTAGGIPLGEVNLASMESRRCPGLFLVGELLDVDGITGGFNFQHCWSSGWLVGQALLDLLED
jgi:predicted Rossmann fold flavoprotein